MDIIIYFTNMTTSKLKIVYVVCLIFVLDSARLEIWQKGWTDLKFILEIKVTGFAGSRCEIERNWGNKNGS